MSTLDVNKPAITATIMITVLMTDVMQLLDALILLMTVMMETIVLMKNVHQENVTSKELTATMVMLVLMIAVK
jgi:hypothetical protein